MIHRTLFRIWFCTEICLFGLFLAVDFYTGTSDSQWSRAAKYASIVAACSAVQFIGGRGYGRRDRIVLQTALLLTGAADLLIGLLGQFISGIAIFLVVQMLYVIRHSRGARLDRHILTPSLLLLLPIGTLLFFFRERLSAAGFLLPACVYALAVTVSLVAALQSRVRGFYDRKTRWLVPSAMTLFFACDVNVGLFYAHVMPALSGTLVWVFYLPAQVLLVVSGLRADFIRSLLRPDMPAQSR